MEIALIGAPGSGKSKLAKRIQKEFPEFKIVDRYAEKVGRESGLAIGRYQGYVGNLLIASERLKKEVGHAKKKEDFITCGTLLETIAYMAMYASTPNVPQSFIERTTLFLKFLGMLGGDWLVYHQCFYLPPKEGDDPVAGQIEEAISTWELPCAKLGGDLDEQAEEAIRIIRELRTAEESQASE